MAEGSVGQTQAPSGAIATFQLGWASGVALSPGGVLTHWGFSVGIGPSHPGTYSVIGEGSTTECAVHDEYGTLQCWGSNANGIATPPTGLP